MSILLYGLQVALIGMLVVFAGLCVLVTSIKLIEAALKRGSKPSLPTTGNTAPEPAGRKSGAQVIDPLPAIIAAAVAAALGGESSSGFVVRRVRRVRGAPAWNRAGREEQIYSRL